MHSLFAVGSGQLTLTVVPLDKCRGHCEMFKVELEAGDLGEYRCCSMLGLGDPFESGVCFQLGLFCLTPEKVVCAITTSKLVCACLSQYRGAIILDWEFVAWNTNNRIP